MDKQNKFDACIYYLEGTNKEIYELVTEMIGVIGKDYYFPKSTIMKLLECLKRDDKYIRYACAYTLTEIRSYLIGLLRNDKLQDIRESIICMLFSDVIIWLSKISSDELDKNKRIKEVTDVIVKYADEIT